MTARLALMGYYGGWNAGDEAILECLVTELRDVDPDVEIDVLTTRFAPLGYDTCDRLGVRAVPLRSPGVVRSLLTQRLLIGGGQMITGGGRNTLLCLLCAMAAVNRLAGRRPLIAFCGAHNIESPWARRLVRVLSRCMTYIALRDQPSVDALTAAGVEPSKLRLSYDVVLGGALSRRQPSDPPPDGGPVLVVGHRSPIRSLLDIDVLADVVAACAAGSNEVVVLSHDSRQAFDDGLGQQLAKRIGSNGWRFVPFRSFEEHLELYRTAAHVISVRMHPLIIASTLGRPATALAGSSKVDALTRRLGMAIIDLATEPFSLPDVLDSGRPNDVELPAIRTAIRQDVDAALASSSGMP